MAAFARTGLNDTVVGEVPTVGDDGATASQLGDVDSASGQGWPASGSVNATVSVAKARPFGPPMTIVSAVDSSVGFLRSNVTGTIAVRRPGEVNDSRASWDPLATGPRLGSNWTVTFVVLLPLDGVTVTHGALEVTLHGLSMPPYT
jgi:hypothetical protein